ncbi:hypothetical protein, conserved [Babesia bigemina]|uniref:C3H1-type domain-containing protein n=1 Tax=Babesia bigemina TaxID=5866 RepID=A0A061BKB2_BABBI|nr:hypothetical protein, conserved [Babesia bigemina]CDR71915.1 hypothetical protein, conserved [Babesia bigemina]|eukprot:XP_012770857.1 hypothetical protein, conserved [Babesia bigemina]
MVSGNHPNNLYGNGGNGDGLDQLAKALKKLIEEAIEKAEKSLEAEKSKLSCPFKYSDKETYCQYYEKKIEDSKKRQKSDNGKKSLNLEILEKSLDKCKKQHSDYPKSQAYKDIDSKLSQVENLKKSLEGLTKEDNCKNLLENLCSGLETFLGFDPNSKGYDGSGIVYSDLDRLCDGVMGFLSGVLSNIQGHLGQHKDTLDDAITSLKQNKHAGKKGFNDAIVKVVEGVRGYNKAVEQSNTSIRNPIRTLLKYVKAEKGTLLDGLNAIQVSQDAAHDAVEQAERQMRDKLTECQQAADTFNTAFNLKTQTDMNKSITDLNDKIETKVRHSIGNVKHESERLRTLAQKERSDLDATIKVTTDTLENLRSGVRKNVCERVTTLVSNLKNIVTLILKELRAMNLQLEWLVKELKQWMEEAKKIIKETLRKQVEEIRREIDEDAGSKNPNHKKSLLAEITKLEKALGTKVSELDEWKAAGTEAVRLAQKKCNEVVKKLNGDDQKQPGDKGAVKQAAKVLQDKADQLRQKAFDAKQQVEALVVQAIGAVKVMDGVLKEELAAVKSHIKTKLLDYIKTKLPEHIKTALLKHTDKIAKDETSLLGAVVANVTAYATGFKDLFEKYIKEMVTKIVNEKNGTAETYIDFYVGENVTTHRQLNAKSVKEAIRDYIPSYVKQLVTEAATESGIHGITDLDQLTDKFQSFVTKMELKIPQAMSIETTVTAIEADLQSKQKLTKPNTGKQQYLKTALEIIIPAVNALAQDLSKEIYNILKTCQIRNLKTAMDEIKGLGRILEEKLKDTTGPNPLSIQATERIKTILDGQLPEASGSVDVNTASTLITYRTHVSTAFGETTGKLPSAINNIQKQGLASLAELVNEPGNDDTIGTQTFNKSRATVDTSLTAFTDKVKDLVDKSPKSDTDSVHAYLLELDKMLGKDPVSLTAADMNTHTDVKGLVTIKEEIQKLKDTNITDVRDYLKFMCGYVRNHAKDIDSQLDNLADNLIDKQLKDLHDQLNTLQSKTLDKIIKATETFINTDTKVLQQKCIDELYEYLDRQVGDVKQQLSTHARRQYVSSIDALLRAFAKKTESELKPLLIEVNSDLNIGLKGFMKKFDEKFVGSIEAIGAIDATSFTVQGLRKIYPLSQAANKFNTCLKDSFEYLEKQKDLTSDLKQIDPSKEALRKLLAKLVQSQHFDHEFCNNLDALTDELNKLTPGKFGQPNTVLSQAFKEGFADLASVLGKAYVNRYSGKTFDELVQNADTDKAVLTTEGRNVAKAFLTLLEMLVGDLKTLREKCEAQWNGKQIHRISGLGSFLIGCGYKVATKDNSQDGELRRHEDMIGNHILNNLKRKLQNTDNIKKHFKICGSIEEDENGKKKKGKSINVLNVLKCLHHHLETYYTVGHMATFTAKRIPCSVYEMLVWCAGLLYNPVNPVMQHATITELFDDPAKQNAEDEIIITQVDKNFIDAAPHAINYQGIVSSLDDLCAQSYDVLTRVLGTGDAETTYASDYCNNSHNFYYPQKGDDCLDMLLDILRRMFPPLKFLMHQCSYPTGIHGWSSCQYGKTVSSAKWPCKGHPKDKPNDQPNDEPTCQPKSPLQSYLNDSLPGWLPHSLSGIGCRPKCANCPGNKPGMQCLTPLGFRGFSGTTRTGRDICDVLEKYFTNTYHTSLFSLVPRPPSTLAEHQSFVLSLMRGINADKPKQIPDIKTLSAAFESSISKLTIELYKNADTLTTALEDAYGSNQQKHDSKKHETVPVKDSKEDVKKGDLSSLSMTTTCSGQKCAPYLSSLASDSYYYMTNKNTDTYLSWVTYLPWTFWNLLNSLYNSFCAINCQDWGCRGCLRGDVCKKGAHGVVDKVKPNAVCRCDSIVQCKGVSATLYQYGLCFGEPFTLNEGTTLKKCSDFCTQLSNVLNSTYFSKLFEKCDEFIFAIRQPFIWMNVALWSLSLFYLLCVMVGRLDVLHIRSHLRIPSSHKITAQSLLAAAQVGRLAKISYLQP